MKESVFEDVLVSTEINMIYEQLEKPNWAPWLQFGAKTLAKQSEVFPEGQISILDEKGVPRIALSANRIEWDGLTGSLPTWDDIAGESCSYEDTYKKTGNTFALMSMAVRREEKGAGLSNQIIEMVQEYAEREDIQHIIGDFRPSNFADYKRQTGQFNFEDYIALTREDGLPADGWLRTVTRKGMKVLRPDARAMVIMSSLDDLGKFSREYKPEQWWQVKDPAQLSYLLEWHQPLIDIENVDEVWECGETGTWYIDSANGRAVYIESNVWGELPTHDDENADYIADDKHESEEIFSPRYDLTNEEVQALEKDLVETVKASKPQQGIYGVWISTKHTYSNLIRTLEAGTPEFEGIEKIVTPSAEARTKFFALIDTRQGHDRVIHATRISGSVFEESFSIDDLEEGTGFIAINELVASGQNFSAQEFIDYYESIGVNLDSCIGVETNFTVGERSETGIDGIRVSDLGYISLFNQIEKKGLTVGGAGVFAFINDKTERSLAAIGITFEALAGRDDLLTPDIDGGLTDKFKPVIIPTSADNVHIFKSLQPFAAEEIELT